VSAGAEGLIFLPYLTGERTPHADPFARGVFFGLSLKHTAAHLTRAVLEGVTYGMRDSLELIRGLGVKIHTLRLSGGGARNLLWCRIQAAVYGETCARLTREEGPALGAAMLAGIGVGAFRDYAQACRVCVAEKDRFQPDPTLKRLYGDGYRTFRKLYPALKPIFPDVA
jgi:xylulokinase